MTGRTGAAAVAALLALAGCGEGKAPAPAAPPPPEVATVTVAPRRLELTVELPGRTAAFRVAEVRPQVGGIVQRRLFREGAEVRAGEQLYEIDPAPYRAALASAQADLARAEAAVVAARAKAGRFAALVRTNGVSRQEADDATAARLAAEAQVAAGRAAVETARINLDRTRVLSPISGRIGKSMASEGALATSNQADALASVQQLDPIYVDLVQPVGDAMRARRAGGGARVTIRPEGLDEPRTGELQFSDVTVDQATGTVQLRAVLPNPDQAVLPGLFVRATVTQGVVEDAILVPQRAVSRTPDGKGLVWVVDGEGKASPRPVGTGRAVGGDWLVTEGLRAGDRVVVEGLQRLRQPGAPVKAVDFAPPGRGQPASPVAAR